MTRRLLSIALLLAACSSSDPEPIQRSLQGTVRGLHGQAIVGASVAIVGTGSQATSDGTGAYEIVDPPQSGVLAVRFEAPAFGSVIRRVDFAMVDHLDAVLTPFRTQEVALPAAGQVATVVEGIAELTIESDTFVHADGTAVTGTVDVAIVPFDPIEPTTLPADLITDGGASLVSMGMADITVLQDGERLQPGPGKEIGFAVSVNEALQILEPDAYHLWYLDEETGLWQDYGPGTFDAGTRVWTANLPHLSTWNADSAWTGQAQVRGRVLDGNNEDVAGASLAVGGGWGWGTSTNTNSSGQYAVTIPAPSGGAETPSTSISASASRSGQRLENPTVTRTFPTSGVTTVDFQMCILPQERCNGRSSRCCDGLTCDDGFCL